MSDNNNLKNQKDNVAPFSNFKLYESIVIATIPLVVYLLVFTFEAGYFTVFKLPFQFISFDVAEIFIAFMFLLAFAFVVFNIIKLLSLLLLKENTPPVIVHKLQSYAPVVILVLPSLLFYSSTNQLLGFGIGLAWLLLADFVFPIFTIRKPMSYIAKLAKSEENKQRTRNKDSSIIDDFIRIAGRNVAKATFYFIFILLISYQTGKSMALQKRSYFVVNSHPETAVLYTARDYAIVTPFDRDDEKLGPGFQVIVFEGNSNLLFRNEQTGILQIEIE